MGTRVDTYIWRDQSYHQLALCLLKTSQFDKLWELGSGGSLPHQPYYQALYLAQKGDLQGALEALRPLASQGHSKAQLLAFRLLIHQARVQFQQNDFEAFAQVLEEVQQVMPDQEEVVSKELKGFQEILPYCYLKVGKRQEAAELWLRDLWSQGASALHKLAILYYQWAVYAEERLASKGEGAQEQLDDLWRKAIAFWVALAGSEGFWSEWSRARLPSYGVTPNLKDLADLKKHIVDDLLSGRFRHYVDKYTDAGLEPQAARHRRYLSLVRREKQAAFTWQRLFPRFDFTKQVLGIDLAQKVPLQATLRALQQAAGQDPCFQGPPQERCHLCPWRAICRGPHPLGAEAVLPLEFFGGPLMAETFGLTQLIQEIVKIQATGLGSDEEIERMEDYISPLGLALVLLEERLPEQALQALDSLPPDLRASPLGKYLKVAAWAENGRRLETQDLNQALEAWEKAVRLIREWKKVPHLRLHKRLPQLEEDLAKWVSESCIREARRLKRAERVHEAIDLLERGLKIAATEDLKMQLADLYCETGRAFLDKNQFQAARKEFEKALSIKPGYVKAKEGMSTSYNNEGVTHHDAGRFDEAIRLQRKALEYNPNNQTSRKNLAGSLNAKGVRKVDVEFEQAYTRDRQLAILLEALELFKEAHEYDPTDDAIVRNHNKLVEVLRNIRIW